MRPGDLPVAPVGFGVVHGEQPVAQAAGDRGQPAEQDLAADGHSAAERAARARARRNRTRKVQVSARGAPEGALGCDIRAGPDGSASSHGGLFLLVRLLVLITSLALLARSRAWVVFRWVGVAAPAQRCVRGMAQRMAARSPDRCGCCRGCRATVRILRHNGSGCGRCGLMEMAVPPLPHVARSRGATSLSPVRALSMARGLLSVTPGSPSTPLSAGRLRMTSAI